MFDKVFGGHEKINEQETETEIEQRTEKQLELLEVRNDKSAKTFVYRDPAEGNKRKRLWDRLLDRKSRSVE